MKQYRVTGKHLYIGPHNGHYEITWKDVHEFTHNHSIDTVYIGCSSCSSYHMLDQLLSRLCSLNTLMLQHTAPYDEALMKELIVKWIKQVKNLTAPSKPWILEAIKNSSLVQLSAFHVEPNVVFQSLPPTLRSLNLCAWKFRETSWRQIIDFLKVDTRLVEFNIPVLSDQSITDQTKQDIVDAILYHPTLVKCYGYTTTPLTIKRMVRLVAEPPVPKDILRHIYCFMIK